MNQISRAFLSPTWRASKAVPQPASTEADLRSDLSELRGIGRNRQVAQRCQYIAAADRKAVDGARSRVWETSRIRPCSSSIGSPTTPRPSYIVPHGRTDRRRRRTPCPPHRQHDARNVAVVGGNLQTPESASSSVWPRKALIDLGRLMMIQAATVADFVDHIGEFGRSAIIVKPHIC